MTDPDETKQPNNETQPTSGDTNVNQNETIMRSNRADTGGLHAWVFWCPGCKTHHGVGPTWTFNGDMVKPTFEPSILVTWDFGPERAQKRCHSFVRDGMIQFLADCTHELAGQTVAMESMHKGDDGDLYCHYCNQSFPYHKASCEARPEF